MKKPTKSIITSSLLAVALGALSIGSTFALFTSQAETEIDVASGKVSVSQQLSIEEMTSALAGSSADYSAYTRQDGWVNGGTAEVGTNGTLTVSKMTPGDELVFKAQMKNESNVNIKYRYVFRVTDSTSLLASGLDITLAGVKYAGLLNYKSDWMTLEPSVDPAFADLIEGKIYMPLERDNVFQDLSATYLLSIEAVQGNAYTEAGASFECAAYLPKAQVLDVNEKATVAYEETATAPAVNVELDFSGNNNYEAGQEVVLNVNTVDVVENQSSFVVSDNSSAAAAIDLNLYIDGTQVTDNFVAKISTKVAAGLTNIKVEYNTTDTSKAFHDGGTRVETLDALDQPGEFYYDASTGELVFVTDHFSDYIVTADNIVAYNKTRKVSYVSLQDAIDQANAGDTVCLLKDITPETPQTVNGGTKYSVGITKSLTLDGKGHTITAKSGVGISRVMGITGLSAENKISVTLQNVTLKANASSDAQCIRTSDYIEKLVLDNVFLDNTYATNGNVQCLTIAFNEDQSSFRNIEIKNSKIANKDNVKYAIIFYAPTNMTLDNSYVNGWAALYLKAEGGGSTIVMNGGGLTSVGLAGGSSNSFACINIEKNGSLQTNTVVINDAEINVSTQATDSAYQRLVTFSGWYGPNISNSVSINNSKIVFNGTNTDWVSDTGGLNTLVIHNSNIDFKGQKVTDYSYSSNNFENAVALMRHYDQPDADYCAGFFDIDDVLYYSSYLLRAGEWLDFYDAEVTLHNDVTLGLVDNASGTIGFIVGNTKFTTGEYHITLTAGVVLNSDVQLASVFAALEGYHIVESEISGETYHYSYTAVANA